MIITKDVVDAAVRQVNILYPNIVQSYMFNEDNEIIQGLFYHRLNKKKKITVDDVVWAIIDVFHSVNKIDFTNN